MQQFSVKKLAKMAGVTVRTLHHYDRIGLLKPAVRTGARYRFYGERELLRLQQILFYREMDFELKEIARILDSPDFDLLRALEDHRNMLMARKQRIDTLLTTLENTMLHLKNKVKMDYERLYEGLPKDQAEAWRKEAIAKWPGQVEHAERELLKMSPAEFEKLQKDFKRNTETLASMSHLDPAAEEVQAEIASHYAYILRFWGKPGNSAEAYKGLGDLYATDERYTTVNGAANPGFGRFLQEAIHHFVETRLT